MPSKRLLMRQARDHARTEVTRLDDERLALKRIAARECGMVLYTQEIALGQHAPPERVHILSLPHEVPWADAPTPEGDAEWFRLPEREMRRIKRQTRDVCQETYPPPRLGSVSPSPVKAKAGEGVSNNPLPGKSDMPGKTEITGSALLGVRIRTRGDGRMVVEDL